MSGVKQTSEIRAVTSPFDPTTEARSVILRFDEGTIFLLFFG
jgi:hypothetical protein